MLAASLRDDFIVIHEKPPVAEFLGVPVCTVAPRSSCTAFPDTMFHHTEGNYELEAVVQECRPDYGDSDSEEEEIVLPRVRGSPYKKPKEGRRRSSTVILSCRRTRSTRLESGTCRLYRDRGSTSSG